MTEGILSQPEIDQLVEGIRSGRVPTGRKSLVGATTARPVDLMDPNWSQDRIIRKRLPVLDLVFERLAPAVQISLTKHLRFPVRAELAGIELKKFADFRSEYAGAGGVFQILRLEPLRGYSILTLAPAISFALIDALMGGLGVADAREGRELSDIEVELLSGVHSELMRDLENAWRPWFPLRVEAVRPERQTPHFTALPDAEVCHVARLLIAGDVLPECALDVVLPYTSIEPLHDAITSRTGEETEPDWRANLDLNLRKVRAEVRCVLGTTELPASRVRALDVGDVIELPVRTDDEVSIEVERRPTFRGRLGKSHLKYGVRVTERRSVEQRTVDRTAGFVLVRKGLLSPEQLAVAQIDERLNRRPIIDSIVSRGWVERSVLETTLAS
ncbi:MAG: flagellar motor switch protein FliM [Myxococcota bacterium]